MLQPRLAALLQKYVEGVAVAEIYNSPRPADPVYQIMDEETSKIDFRWKKHYRERWKARPTDMISGQKN